AQRVFHVRDDSRQLRFWRQSIVNRDHDVASLEHFVFEARRDPLAVPHDECAAVDPHDDGALAVIVGAIDVGLDFQGADLLVREGLLANVAWLFYLRRFQPPLGGVRRSKGEATDETADDRRSGTCRYTLKD